MHKFHPKTVNFPRKKNSKRQTVSKKKILEGLQRQRLTCSEFARYHFSSSSSLDGLPPPTPPPPPESTSPSLVASASAVATSLSSTPPRLPHTAPPPPPPHLAISPLPPPNHQIPPAPASAAFAEIQIAEAGEGVRARDLGREDEEEDEEQDHTDDAAGGGGGDTDWRDGGADPDGGNVEGEDEGVAREDLQQGVGVLGQQVLLQRHHHRLLQGVPVREPLRQAQQPRRPRRRILGLPGLHHRRRALRAARVLHHGREADADDGALRLPRPRRLQDLLWVWSGDRRADGVGALLQPRDEPQGGLLRQDEPAVPLRRGRRVLRPRRHPRLLELQLWRGRRGDPRGPSPPPGVPGAERDDGVHGGDVAVDDTDEEEAAVGARRVRRELEAHQERHARQEAPGLRRHHERALRRPDLRQGLHRRHERHHLPLPVLPRPHGCRPRALRRQPRLRRAGRLQPVLQEARRPAATKLVVEHASTQCDGKETAPSVVVDIFLPLPLPHEPYRLTNSSSV